jgi:hypothetical protein
VSLSFFSSGQRVRATDYSSTVRPGLSIVCVCVRACAYMLFLDVGGWVKVWAFIHKPVNATYVYRGIKARSRKHCYRGKAIKYYIF